MMKRRGLIVGSFDTAAHGFTMAMLHLEVPPARQDFVEVDGMSGALDYSEASGCVIYQTCRLEAVFELSEGTKEHREKIIGEFIRSVHGKSCRIEHPDHGGKILTGRVQLTKDYSDLAHAQVSLSAVCQPWFEEPHAMTVELPIRDRSCNQITANNVTVMDALTDCDAGFTGDTESVTVGLATLNSPIHSKAVFRVKLEANETYFICARLIGRGFWRVSSAPTMPTVFSPVVNVGDDGYLYIFVERLQSYGAVTLTDIVILSGSNAQILHNGSFSVLAKVQKPAGAKCVLGIAGQIRTEGDDVELPAGDVPVMAFIRSTSDEDQTVALSFRRRWLE